MWAGDASSLFLLESMCKLQLTKWLTRLWINQQTGGKKPFGIAWQKRKFIKTCSLKLKLK